MAGKLSQIQIGTNKYDIGVKSENVTDHGASCSQIGQYINPINSLFNNLLSSNRLEGLSNSSAVEFRYGNINTPTATWTRVTNTDIVIAGLFNSTQSGQQIYMNGSITRYIPTTFETGLNIRIDTYKANLYAQISRLMIHVSNISEYKVKVDVQGIYNTEGANGATLAAKPNVVLLKGVDIGGNSGWTALQFETVIFGGYESQWPEQRLRYIDLTFYLEKKTTSQSSTPTTPCLGIHSICAFGNEAWITPTNVGKTGHIYSYDSNQNVTFPAGVQASLFKGSIDLGSVIGADDLKAIESLSGTSGLLKKTGNNSWALDTTAYTTDVTPTVSISNTQGIKAALIGTISTGKVTTYMRPQGEIKDIPNINGVGELFAPTINVGWDLNVEGPLTVGEDAEFNSNVDVTRNLTVEGDLKVTGETYLNEYAELEGFPIQNLQVLSTIETPYGAINFSVHSKCSKCVGHCDTTSTNNTLDISIDAHRNPARSIEIIVFIHNTSNVNKTLRWVSVLPDVINYSNDKFDVNFPTTIPAGSTLEINAISCHGVYYVRGALI